MRSSVLLNAGASEAAARAFAARPLSSCRTLATFERPVNERVLTRPVRDAAFKRVVREAYGAT